MEGVSPLTQRVQALTLVKITCTCLLVLACSITYNISFIATQMAEGSQECFLLAFDQSSPGSVLV